METLYRGRTIETKQSGTRLQVEVERGGRSLWLRSNHGADTLVNELSSLCRSGAGLLAAMALLLQLLIPYSTVAQNVHVHVV